MIRRRRPCPILALIAAILVLGASPVRALETSIVVDGTLGAVVQATHPNRRVPPASLTKMMTAYILFEELSLGRLRMTDDFIATKSATQADPVRIGLGVGELVPVKDAIKALLGRSANDVAVMIAENIGGSEEAFAERMTETAHRLGMNRTRFATASGLPAPLEEQYTTARDMAVLALALLDDFPGFYRFFSLTGYTFKGTPQSGHNAILNRYPGADGLKTGFTCASGYNLVASATHHDRRMVGVILGNATGSTRTNRMVTLLNTGFAKELTEKTQFLDGIAPDPDSPDPPVADNTNQTPICGSGVAGYAVDLGINQSQSRSADIAEQGTQRYGGMAFTMPRPGGGTVRWKAYVGGLDGTTARKICRARQAAGLWCLVRTPAMVRADFQAAARLRRAQ
ncbi:MAG: D-alanyl-D-alanine carboxypeptidase [Rhodospirillum sp.]|nr:D-alanyl-D-alanine carboxypeptidase [Rhodospirillum sp.]MCF8489132.1 D-alanyl-D-alanine carboxypeptidase [Rhodospirillum sp.]MCF8498922.1 D-alanyl-D-alanine carboxypeptidase [Rhodospirillum sp.]